ncbi:succinate dehydrogenase, cytochrome b556 subunit [Thiofilum flexile]|uniref:succinate dehydrogenase, cytochrome b556 subunit n=1 Tax=Thiofilum flexile TaxID=125627 RepID=UPI0004754F69|nr:succinate dehydrogenase, cytochrome b556 subunit [Thiofilum flexile]
MQNSTKRPLSPFMLGTHYKWQLTSATSLLHRATGIAAAVGSLVVVYWLTSLAAGPQAFDIATSFLGSWLGKFILFFWTWALFYHLCNGIRHLMWDLDYGFDLPTTYLTGKIVIIASAILNLLLWLVA